MTHANLLDIKSVALLIVDVQEAFRNAIPDFELVAERISRVVRGFEILGAPIFITEQYPKGLGRTAEEILFSFTGEPKIFEKTKFSACGSTELTESFGEKGVNQVVVCGIETHVCVNQTAHELMNEGYQVHTLEDCVSSRDESNKKIGLEKIKLGGAIPSSIEMALFEIMRDSKHEKFREIQALIK
jgi:nicotinamidase-related amidase